MSDLLSLLVGEEWKEDAPCRGQTPIFFPEYPSRRDKETDKGFKRRLEQMYANVDKAKSICEQCPVSQQCEELGEREEFGIWNGVVKEIWWDEDGRT